ncbi:hypothetical protein [Mycolicibacterium nivoides]|uniref:Secreted protein n=1 Tax=Mycolicibacterium nivoides TaxID=2487344 RepID=A0ABW9L7G0_9MYCO
MITVHKRTAGRILAAAASIAVFTCTGVGFAARAGADPIIVVVPAPQPVQFDPYVPNPPAWCPGGGSSSGWGGYCEGKTFKDGTRLNLHRIGFAWQPLRCIIPDGSPFPPVAGPGGCGGAHG